jgi:hypothetical protein
LKALVFVDDAFSKDRHDDLPVRKTAELPGDQQQLGQVTRRLNFRMKAPGFGIRSVTLAQAVAAVTVSASPWPALSIRDY